MATFFLFVIPSLINGNSDVYYFFYNIVGSNFPVIIFLQLCWLFGRCFGGTGYFFAMVQTSNAVVQFLIYTLRHRDLRRGIKYLFMCKHMGEQEMKLVGGVTMTKALSKSQKLSKRPDPD